MADYSFEPVDHDPFNGAFGTGSPGEEASRGQNFLGNALMRAATSLATLPKRAFGASEEMRQGGAYNAGPALEAATLPMGTGAIAGVPMRAGEAVLGAGPIRAYHGSPYDFDRFDVSKIGTGEGAQAYGHGLYFAEHEPVAMQYRDQLKWKGANFDDPQVLAQNAIDRDGSREAAAANLQDALDSVVRFHRGKVPAAQAEANKQTEQAIALLRGNEPITGAANTPGRMYEVNINADPAHFLDWDKPLSQQAPQVQEALKKVMGPNWDEFKHADAGTAVKQGFIAPSPEATAANLGVPGIKYLDQGSRTAGEGSHNYVVFDDKLIDIIKKYGFAGLTSLPAVRAMSHKLEPVDHDPFEEQ